MVINLMLPRILTVTDMVFCCEENGISRYFRINPHDRKKFKRKMVKFVLNLVLSALFLSTIWSTAPAFSVQFQSSQVLIQILPSRRYTIRVLDSPVRLFPLLSTVIGFCYTIRMDFQLNHQRDALDYIGDQSGQIGFSILLSRGILDDFI